MYSRSVEVDKICECIGGKDDTAKACMDAYLERQDFTEKHIERRLRSFM